jgi:hypothetical protein
MIDLKKVTLIAVDGTGKDTQKILNVIDICTKKIKFGETVLVSADESIEPKNEVAIHKINKMTYPEYNSFCILDMNKYVNTEFCLIVQTDGYICKPSNWKEEFLNYDYIGCPWMGAGPGYFSWVTEPKYQVGCGGFCLRSKKLLEAGSRIDRNLINHLTHRGIGEDVLICVTLRDHFEKSGCQFPTGEFAKSFALGSAPLKENELETTFGFHNANFIPLVNEMMKSW